MSENEKFVEVMEQYSYALKFINGRGCIGEARDGINGQQKLQFTDSDFLSLAERYADEITHTTRYSREYPHSLGFMLAGIWLFTLFTGEEYSQILTHNTWLKERLKSTESENHPIL